MCKTFYSVAKLIANESEINQAFGSLHQSAVTKIKKLW